MKIIIPANTATKLVKLGPGYSEIFGVICRFLPYRHKRVIVKSVNSGVTGPNATKIVHNAKKFILLNLSNQNCDISIRFGMATKEIGPIKTLIFTARRLAKRGICRRRVSVCVCVCVCVCVRHTPVLYQNG